MKLTPSTGDRPPAAPPSWSGTFVVPRGACPACRDHLHHRCRGGNPLLDPLEDCPCDCGDARNQLFMNDRAWDDLARHAPWAVGEAHRKEALYRGGVHICERRRRWGMP